MSQAFVNAWRPNPVGANAPIEQIEGEIPRELNGTLYRNGPNQKILPKTASRRSMSGNDSEKTTSAPRIARNRCAPKKTTPRQEISMSSDCSPRDLNTGCRLRMSLAERSPAACCRSVHCWFSGQRVGVPPWFLNATIRCPWTLARYRCSAGRDWAVKVGCPSAKPSANRRRPKAAATPFADRLSLSQPKIDPSKNCRDHSSLCVGRSGGLNPGSGSCPVPSTD